MYSKTHIICNYMCNRKGKLGSKLPFCALGSDEALEHQNRAMKVVGGLVGITQQRCTARVSTFLR
jgi:hypothetical protein